MFQFFSGPMPLDLNNCKDTTDLTICPCTHSIQTVQVNSSKPHLFTSCLDLEATIDFDQGDRLGHLAFLVASKLTLIQNGTLERVELYSDAVNTVIEGFNATSLTLVSPGNTVTISNGRFVNANIEIISAENVLIKDTSFSGKGNLQEYHEQYFGNPFPSSTSTFTVANAKNLRSQPLYGAL